MKRLSLLLVACLAFAVIAGSAFAQDQVKVHFKLSINQPTLFDDKAQDSFQGSLDDALGTVTLNWRCSAGQKGILGFGRADETCAIMDQAGDPKSTGVLKSPTDPTKTKKWVDYTGGFVIEAKKDGYTDMTALKADYGLSGSVKSSSYGGTVTMLPDNPTADVLALAQKAIEYAKKKAGGTTVEINTKIDPIQFNNLVVPESGQKGSVACSLKGPVIYAYATDAFQTELAATCGSNSFQLNGNMSIVDAPAGSDHDQEYQINLIMGEGNGDPFAEADPFAVVTGFTGTLNLKNSGRESDGVYQNVEIEGDIIGTGLPPELVRAYAQILLTFPRYYFGA